MNEHAPIPSIFPPHDARRLRGTRVETQSRTLASSPERVLETPATTTREETEDTIAISAFQNPRTMPQNRTRPVDRYNTLLRNTFVGLPGKFPLKHAPEQLPTSFTLPDRHLRIQGQFFAGKTLLAPVEEGYKPHGEERRKEATEIFLQYEEDTLRLSQTLLMFHESVHRLGSNVSLLKAVDVLRTDLLMLLALFCANANAHLKGLSQSESCVSNIREALSKRLGQEGRQTRDIFSEIASVPEGLDQFADALDRFLNCLNEVSKFAEEYMKLTVDRCTQEIRYRASTLRDVKGRMSETDVALYANDVAGLLGDQLAAMDAVMMIFKHDGVSNMQYVPTQRPPITFNKVKLPSRSQDLESHAVQNLSTASALLSAVTVSTVQAISFTRNHLATYASALWFISLWFSFASVVHGQLACHWIRHSHRTPSLKMRAFWSFLIVKSPLVFFVVSAAAFSGGVIAYAYFAFGSSPAPTVAVTCGSITIGTMILVACWIASEKSELRWPEAKVKNIKSRTSSWAPSRFAEAAGRLPPLPALGHASVPTQRDLESRSSDAVGVLQSGMRKIVESKPGRDGFVNEQSPFVPVNKAPVVGSTFAAPSVHMRTSAGNRLENEVVASDILAEAQETPPQTIPIRQLAPIATPSPPPSFRASQSDNDPSRAQQPTNHRDSPRLRLRHIKLALHHRELGKCAFKLQPFASAIRRIAFSPDGRFLASCAWEPGVEVWKVKSHESTDISLCHCPESSIVNDVVWCPDPEQPRFLALCGEVITLWQQQAEDLTFTQTGSIRLADSAHCVAWMLGNRFVAASKSKIYMIDVIDRTLMLFSKRPITIKSESEMSIIDITILPNQLIAWIIVDIKKTAENRLPLGAPERRLLEINIFSGEVRDQLPFIYPVRSIVASSDGDNVYGVLTFSNEASSVLIEKKEGSSLKIVHPFLTTAKVDTAGRTSMGSLPLGASNQLVIGADRGGTVYFWDRKTATRLHELDTDHEAPGLAHAAWNHASNDCLMLATATDDGHICLWSAPAPEECGCVLQQRNEYAAE